ncbi:hypothetical protein [uncultured Tateyamaria sp.]|uniref:hypothetical protein n=1 Tax=uncultured Tateyamaria sp. TaxID=455651 RepID=UPI00263A2DCB|nr:hypothetical protein [uncultured Tateyamaria sp.]
MRWFAKWLKEHPVVVLIGLLGALIGGVRSILGAVTYICTLASFCQDDSALTVNLNFASFDYDFNYISATKFSQSTEINGSLKVKNFGETSARIHAVLLENTAVASQLYSVEGCGWGEIEVTASTVPANGFEIEIPTKIFFGLDYSQQMSGYVSSHSGQIDLGINAEYFEEIIRDSMNILVFWSDPNGSFYTKIQNGDYKNFVEYDTGIGDRDICRDPVLRSELGLTTSERNEYRAGLNRSFRIGDTTRFSDLLLAQ